MVCNRLTIRIHTQFTGHPTETHSVLLAELDQPAKLALLRRIWTAPESFRPKKTSRDITEAAARSFATLAAQLRKAGHDPQKVSHFLTQCLFCFFADDVGLLPARLFEKMINAKLDLPTKTGRLPSEKLTGGLATLFKAMRSGNLFGVHDIDRFNGGLFKIIDVPQLDIMNVTELRNAAEQNWSAIDVSIFGTLFERGLDPAKRSQLGAHYTDPATIERIVEPVLRRPLLQVWEQTAQEIKGLLAKSKLKKRGAYSAGGRHYKASRGDASYQKAERLFQQWLDQLKNFRVLDPACGSGNFLFMGLKALKDIEHKSHIEAATLGLEREADLVTGPHNMLGIELNEYAAELARVTVWIGELQWRLLHGYEFKTNPVLEPLDHIECRDALLVLLPPPLGEGGGGGSPRALEAEWPKASVVMGNPPFLGGSKKRRELGDAYFEALASVFEGRVPAGADLVCYWFDKARAAIARNHLDAAGFVATQSIRSGSNRAVLQAIRKESRIFDAWSDEAWVNEGAAVRVSLVSFGKGECCFLNGKPVDQITAELGGSVESDMSLARPLAENAGTSFEGAQKNGPFDIQGQLAREWMRLPNPHSQSNALVLTQYLNAAEVTGRKTDSWMIDFHGYSEREAELFDAPFTYVRRVVKPVREAKREAYLSKKYWLLKRSAIEFRAARNSVNRYIVTPRVAKHRFFVWMPKVVLPDSRLNSIVRADDTTFGLLSSRIHEVWSLAQASIHGDGSEGGRPTYNAKSCFETFPFPSGLTPADTAHQKTEAIEGGALIPADISAQKKARTQKARAQAAIESIAIREHATAIARAAKRLNDLREHWLNPPEWTQRLPEVIPLGLDVSPYPDRIVPKNGHEKELDERTLTKLYNQRPAWLDAAHQALDAAVAAAYGWLDYRADLPDEEILKRLLALNLQRAKAQGATK